MSLSINNISLATLEAKALAELANQSRDALVRALQSLQKNNLIIAEVTRLPLPDTASVPAQNTQTQTLPTQSPQQKPPIVLKFPDAYVQVNSQQEKALNDLVGQEVVVKIDSIEPEIKIRIVATLESYLAVQAQNAQNSQTNIETPVTTSQPLETGSILLNVIQKVQSTGTAQTAIIQNNTKSDVTKTIITSRISNPEKPGTTGDKVVSNDKSVDNQTTKLTTEDRIAQQVTNASRTNAEALLAIIDNVKGNQIKIPVLETNKLVPQKAQTLQTNSIPLQARLQINNDTLQTKAAPLPSLLQAQSLTTVNDESAKQTQSDTQLKSEVTTPNQRTDSQKSVTANIDANSLHKLINKKVVSEFTAIPKIKLSTETSPNNSAIKDTITPEQTVSTVSLEVLRKTLSEGVNIQTGLNQTGYAQANTPPWYNAGPIQDFTIPKVSKTVQVPDIQQFPILNEAIVNASQRLTGREIRLSDSLQKLLSQLSRLEQWSAANKRFLRSSQGHVLNKATTDTIGGLKELQRYVPTPKDLSTARGVKKFIKQTGTFAEQKRLPKSTPLPGSKQANLHADTKVNLQRIVTATLYHIAKLTSLGTTITQPATTAAIADPAMILAPKDKTTVPNDLVMMIKQRLNAYGEQQLPTDLPKRLIQLLQQVLNQSNQALQRTEFQQVANLRSDTQTPQWFFELPIWTGKDTDSLQLLMRKESNNIDREFKQSWSLMLQFDLHTLGKIRAVVKWHDGQTSLLFLANQENTYTLLNQELATMRERASQRNIKLNELEVKQAQLEDIRFELQGAAE